MHLANILKENIKLGRGELNFFSRRADFFWAPPGPPLGPLSIFMTLGRMVMYYAKNTPPPPKKSVSVSEHRGLKFCTTF